MGHLQNLALLDIKIEGFAWDIFKFWPFGISKLAVWHGTCCFFDALASPPHLFIFPGLDPLVRLC